MIRNLKNSYDPLVEEQKIIDLWAKEQAFEKIQGNRLKENVGTYSIHSGPVFPTGCPHIGHVFNAVVKDICMRYGHQRNLRVENCFGWDCHGLPVEHEVDKKLGIKSPEDVQRFGIAAYNGECRRFVQRRQAEWNAVYERMGIWMDFSKAYSTANIEYMEGVWRVFKELYEKGLVHKATKVLPYSTVCFTYLSSFEAEQNWKEISEVEAIISLNIVGSKEKLLIWTIDPWTLAAISVVGVNPSSLYVKVEVIGSGEVYILSKNRVSFVFTSNFVILEEFPGKKLENLSLEFLFEVPGGKVIADECISDDLGTGIVAMSPYFFEADYRVCQEHGIELNEASSPIDETGRFKEHISAVKGLTMTEATEYVLESLQHCGQIFRTEDVKHKRPHCWRSDVPLIQKATTTWFIKVEGLSAEEMSKGWPIGRTRYWGTPIPIWISSNGDEIRCVGSIDELLQLTGVTSISDLHREFVDELVIPSSVPGNPPLRRVPEVFDCWFESGVMPFIQERNQADLIAEGMDQTHGWFYTTSVLSAALNKPPEAKNILKHGLVLAPDGTKFSKRKHNSTDPLRLVDKYGVDALRLYLMTTPLVNGENFKLQETGVREMVEIVMKPLYETLKHFMPYFGKQGWVSYGIFQDTKYLTNIFDVWILSTAESALQFYDSEMKANRFHTVIPRIIQLIHLLKDWYLPISHALPRKRRCEYDPSIAYNIVYKICLMLAPFSPLFIEHIYRILYPFVGPYFQRDSFQDCSLTEKADALIQWDVELKIKRWQRVIELIREERAKHVIPIQYRISELVIVHANDTYLEENELLDEQLMKLVNVHQIRRTKNREEFKSKLAASLKERSSLHHSLSRTDLEKVTSTIALLNDLQIEEVIRNESLYVGEHNVPLDDLQISYEFDKLHDKNISITSEDDLLIVIRMNKDLNYYEEGTRRELISTLQKLRKKVKIFPSELITVYYSTKDKCLRNAFEKYAGDLRKRTNSIVKWIDHGQAMEEAVGQESIEVKGAPVMLYLFKNN